MGDGLSALPRLHSLHVVARVEGRQVELRGRRGFPQAKVDGVVRVEPGDRVVVRHRTDLLAAGPHLALGAIGLGLLLDGTVESNRVRHVDALDLPRVAERQPVIGHLELAAVANDLAEDAVVVTDAVPPGRQIQRRHGVQEARRKPAQAAVTQRRVVLIAVQLFQAVSQLLQRSPGGITRFFRAPPQATRPPFEPTTHR